MAYFWMIVAAIWSAAEIRRKAHCGETGR